ncbi:MAG: Ig-like domain-containing protein [Gemmatimonadota bacterium]|nr:Ig-like domain-containing protein [Gemmatimonadota bacterium]
MRNRPARHHHPGRGLIVALSVALNIGCGGDSSTEPRGIRLTVMPQADTINAIGGEAFFWVTLQDASGQALEPELPTWTSLEPGVAIVASPGQVVAASAGEALVVARSGRYADTARVLVRQVPASFTILPALALIYVDDTLRLHAAAVDSNGVPIPQFTWSSPDVAVAVVDSAGVVRAVAPGSTTVTAAAGGQSRSVPLTVSPPAGDLEFAALAAGGEHTCGLTTTGSAYCWGSNDAGQLGTTVALETCTTSLHGTALPYQCSSRPVPVATGLSFVAIAAGFRHTCALAAGGEAYCWGWNKEFALGNAASAERCALNYNNQNNSGPVVACSRTPVPTSGGLGLTAVATGFAHTCSLTGSGDAYCWGSAGYLGSSSLIPGDSSATPVAVSGGMTFMSLSARGTHTCGVTAGRQAYCWGDNYYFQLGVDSRYQPTPVPVSGGGTFDSVTAGQKHTCALAGNTAYCWGSGWLLGVDPASLPLCRDPGGGRPAPCSKAPIAVDGALTFKSLAAGHLAHTCGVTTAGAAYCWPVSSAPNIINAPVLSYTPALVPSAVAFSTVTTGGSHACGLTATGAAYCWGENSGGQIGDGSFISTTTPSRVTRPR